jgi:gliding motility-associated-like protein
VNVITPNGDGANDYLVFPCLESEKYLRNEIFIFNQWGDQVHTAYNYKNDWYGTYNGKDLPVGTYFYILFLDTERKNALKGFFVIER